MVRIIILILMYGSVSEEVTKSNDYSKIGSGTTLLDRNSTTEWEFWNQLQYCDTGKICHCFVINNSLVADCSHINISVIPRFYPNVTRIYLQSNRIQIMKNQHNEIPRSVVYLDISNNKLDTFVDYPFRNLVNLEHLDLSSNSLKYHSDIYDNDTFKGLENLKFLNLKQNNIDDDSRMSYPAGIAHLLKLRILFLDGVDLNGFSKQFKNLTVLKTLDLSGVNNNCNLELIKSHYFENVPSVQNVNISNCKIRNIELGTFRVLTNLRTLNISKNERLTFKVLSNLTDDVAPSAIETLDVSKLHCMYGPGTVIYMNDIKKLNGTNLRNIYVDSNRLILVEDRAMQYLPSSLTFISMKENRLSFGKYLLYLTSLSNLEIIDARYQYMSHDPKTDLNSMDCNDWRAPPTYDNNLSMDSSAEKFSDHQKFSLTIPFPPKLRKFYFSQCKLEYEMSTEIHIMQNNLEYVDISNNIFHSWKGPIRTMDKLKFVDASNNYCTYISDNFFDGCENIETLLIHNNLLGFHLFTDTSGRIFHRLKRLNYLDLSFNRMHNVPNLLLKDQKDLRILNLSNNELDSIGLKFSHMKQLQYLDLAYNQLHTIKEHERAQIDELTSGNLTVNLLGNVLQCSCDNLKLLKWFESKRKHFDNFSSYVCRFPNNTNVGFSLFDDVLIEMEKTCNSYIGLIVGIVCVIMFSISFIILGVVYRYRWKLRYLYYMAKSRYRGYTSIPDNDNDRDSFKNDAFISYCEQDDHFVRHDLLDNLEKTRELRLCLHQRDFLPGQDIAENITNAVHQSRKTVVILSRNYLKSYWCMYEFNMARMESIYSRAGAPVLLLVFYENITPRDIPLSLMDLIESKSYIEYPNDEQGNVVFWKKMAESICRQI